MKFIASTALLALAITTSGTGAAQVAEAAGAPADGTPITIGVTHRLQSAILGDEREINVWIPPGYEKGTKRYNVLYLLDGALDQDFQHIAGIAQLGALSWTFEPLIVVGIQTKQRRAELTHKASDPRYLHAFPEGGGADKFRRYLTNEVMPFIKARYRTGPKRALIGESLAGLFVMDTFLNHPDFVDDYIAISPSLWWDDRALARNSATLLRSKSLGARRLYVAVGDEGGTMQSGVDMIVAALKANPKAAEWKYVDKSATETHATIYHGAALDAVRWLYKMPPEDYGPTPWFMIEGGSPPPKK